MRTARYRSRQDAEYCENQARPPTTLGKISQGLNDRRNWADTVDDFLRLIDEAGRPPAEGYLVGRVRWGIPGEHHVWIHFATVLRLSLLVIQKLEHSPVAFLRHVRV